MRLCIVPQVSFNLFQDDQYLAAVVSTARMIPYAFLVADNTPSVTFTFAVFIPSCQVHVFTWQFPISIRTYFATVPTNMVAYLWNTDRKATFIKIINALEAIVVLQEPVMQVGFPESAIPYSDLPTDLEPMPDDMIEPGDHDEAQALSLIRMWSGFEPEMITDAQLIELLGLDGYLDTDLPDWMMTDLGVLVAKGDVTVDEFMLALQYVLEHT